MFQEAINFEHIFLATSGWRAAISQMKGQIETGTGQIMKLKRVNVKSKFKTLPVQMAENMSSVARHCMGPSHLSREEVQKLVRHYLVEDFQHPYIIDAVTSIIYQRWGQES